MDFTIQRTWNDILKMVVWQKILKYPLSGKYFLNDSSIKAECITFYLKLPTFSSFG